MSVVRILFPAIELKDGKRNSTILMLKVEIAGKVTRYFFGTICDREGDSLYGEVEGDIIRLSVGSDPVIRYEIDVEVFRSAYRSGYTYTGGPYNVRGIEIEDIVKMEKEMKSTNFDVFCRIWKVVGGSKEWRVIDQSDFSFSETMQRLSDVGRGKDVISLVTSHDEAIITSISYFRDEISLKAILPIVLEVS